MKKNILKFISLSLFVFFGSMLTVSAGTTVLENVFPGDIVIGNSVFTSGTWISATKASKAGSLYTLNTGDVNVKTYINIYDELWYELDADTDEYRALSIEEVDELLENHNIYYTDGDPVMVTYPIKQENSYIEILLSGPATVYDESLVFDSETRSVTCDYGEVYKIEDWDLTSNTLMMTYDLKCDENLMIHDEGYYDAKPIEVVSVSIPSNPENSYLGIEFTNQDKVTLKYDETYNSIIISLNEKIDSSNPYIAFDIKLADGNMFNFGVLDPVFGLSSNLTSAVYNDESIIRFTLRVDDQFGFNSGGEFLILDHIFDTFMRFQVHIEPLEYSHTDLTITPKVATFDGELAELAVNQNAFQLLNTESYNTEFDFTWNLIFNGELESFEYNGVEGKWIALELEMPEDIYLEKITLTGDENAFSEIINDKYYLWYNCDRTNGSRLYFRNNYSSYLYANSINVLFNAMIEKYDFDNENAVFYTFNSKGEMIVDDGVYFDKVNNVLYVGGSQLIYFDNISFYQLNITKSLEDEDFHLEPKPVVAYYLYQFSNDSMVGRFVQANTFASLGSLLSNEYYADKDVTIVYFFNREKTSEELEIINSLSALENVSLIDASSEIYGTTQE